MADLVQDLLGSGGELRETHISWVFLTADDAFKVKKPVSLGFLDFSTKEKRREACEAEVRLNRRLAPNVYRGVLPVTLDSLGRHRFGGEGEPVDWAVSMKRLPDPHRADLRLERGELTGEDIELVAGRVARFHRECGPSEAARPFGTVEAIRFNVLENFEQTRSTIHRYLDAERVQELEAWQLRFLEERRSLFEERLRTGRIRDGHGDLRLEHVYLGAGGETSRFWTASSSTTGFASRTCAPTCVFLAMDLAWHGRVDLAERFLAPLRPRGGRLRSLPARRFLPELPRVRSRKDRLDDRRTARRRASGPGNALPPRRGATSSWLSRPSDRALVSARARRRRRTHRLGEEH